MVSRGLLHGKTFLSRPLTVRIYFKFSVTQFDNVLWARTDPAGGDACTVVEHETRLGRTVQGVLVRGHAHHSIQLPLRRVLPTLHRTNVSLYFVASSRQKR